MKIKLIRAKAEKAELIWKMQVEAFLGLYEKYQDTETSPATEPVDNVIARLRQPFTYYYLIECDEKIVGAIRVVDTKKPDQAKRISPIFVLEQFRNQGIAQTAILEAEKIHGSENWELSTILEETRKCYLYEKIGYFRVGELKKINDKMTLVFYKKN